MEQLRPRRQRGPLDDRELLRPQVRVLVAVAVNHEFRPLRRFVKSGFKMGQQFGEDRHHAAVAAVVMPRLRAVNGHPAAFPINVRPAQPKMLGGAAQPRVTAQGEQETPFIGRWWELKADGCTWKERWKSTCTTVKKEAEKQRRRLAQELDQGRRAESEMTWAEFVEDFLKKHATRKPASTRAVYRQCLNAFTDIAKPKSLARVTHATLEDFATERLELGFAAATVNRDLRHVRAELRWAKRRGYISEVPDFKGVFVRENLKNPVIIPEADFIAMIKALRNPDSKLTKRSSDWWRIFLYLSYYLGCRRGETLGAHMGPGVYRHARNPGSRADFEGPEGTRCANGPRTGGTAAIVARAQSPRPGDRRGFAVAVRELSAPLSGLARYPEGRRNPGRRGLRPKELPLNACIRSDRLRRPNGGREGFPGACNRRDDGELLHQYEACDAGSRICAKSSPG